MSFRGKLRALVATSLWRAVCVVKPRRLAAAIPDGKTVFRRDASCRIAAGLGKLFPNVVGREL
jgi:hypothetical protein